MKKETFKIDNSHLLSYQNELSKKEYWQLKKEIFQIPFHHLRKIYQNSYKDEEYSAKDITPLKYYEQEKIDSFYSEIGSKYYNSYAVLTLSGGSGSRFGYDGPKGTFEFTINNKKESMFSLQALKLKKIYEETDNYLLWLIMTSIENHDAIINYFEKNNYFDYPRENIYFFSQSELPVLNISGQCVLKDKGHVLKASDGNGQVFKSLKTSGMLKELKKRNILYVECINIDNILAPLYDSSFIGLMVHHNYLVGTKTSIKENPDTNEYVFCKYKNKPFLYNLNAIDKSFEKDSNLYQDTFLGISLFHIKALEKLSKINLPYHRAYKHYDYINPDKTLSSRVEKNAFKFEKFIFDGFSYFDDLLLYRIDKEKEFAPIKSQTGPNSLEEAIKKYEKYYH